MGCGGSKPSTDAAFTSINDAALVKTAEPASDMEAKSAMDEVIPGAESTIEPLAEDQAPLSHLHELDGDTKMQSQENLVPKRRSVVEPPTKILIEDSPWTGPADAQMHHKTSSGVLKLIGVIRAKSFASRNRRMIERRLENRIARTHEQRRSQAQVTTAASAPAYDATRWVFSDGKTKGASRAFAYGKKDKVEGVISDGLARFKSQPALYLTISYQTSMTTWPEDQQKYTLLHREGTEAFVPELVEDGWMTIVTASYQRLPRLSDEARGQMVKDAFTDGFSFEGSLLHSEANPPIYPGRGDGVGDVPGLTLMGRVDPCDVAQGSVGDCWLLSGISSLAEFDGAIRQLFRKTEHISSAPHDSPNSYIVTLWDLSTWTEVDVVIDERLPRQADGTGLLGCAPSPHGELWACYVEKAVAAHCGGFDKIDGGQVGHAWALLTGCKEQYTIRLNTKTGKYQCLGAFNPNEQIWEPLTNSPHDGFQGLWAMEWPEAGGGGKLNTELGSEECFERLCAWDDSNYILAASSRPGSDSHQTHGIIDGHAYSILHCVNDAGGTGIDLIKMRNPWGKGGQLEDSEWGLHGPGWDAHPELKAALHVSMDDNGVFWVSKQEFFLYFQTIYLSASDMTEFLGTNRASRHGSIHYE